MKLKPFKPLMVGLRHSGGRNHFGRTTIYHRGGGHKRKYRLIDFVRNSNMKWIVSTVEYDPNRSSNIALTTSMENSTKRYILAANNLFVGQIVEDFVSDPSIDQLKDGNTVCLSSLQIGMFVHNIEQYPNKGGIYVRSAGCYGIISAIDNTANNVSIKLPSGEMKTFDGRCKGTIGRLSNSTHQLIPYGKAGAKRWIGRRPHVRGVAMNPVDHPHGGGEGKTSGGRCSVSPWGRLTKGKKTRKTK